MGFLKGLFKKKPGGTGFGNFLRGVSSSVTGGALGSGRGLAKWEMEHGYRDPKTGEPNYNLLTGKKYEIPKEIKPQIDLTGIQLPDVRAKAGLDDSMLIILGVVILLFMSKK